MNGIDYTKKLIPFLEPNEIRYALKGCQTEGFSITGFNKEPWNAPIPLIQRSMESIHKKRNGMKTIAYKIFLLSLLSSLDKINISNTERSEVISKICITILNEDSTSNYAIDYLFCYFSEFNIPIEKNELEFFSDEVVNLNKLQKELSQLQKSYDKLLTKHTALQEKLDANEDTISNLRQLLKNIKKDKQELEQSILEKDNVINDLSNTLSVFQNDLYRLNDRNLYLTNENRKIESQIEILMKSNTTTIQQNLFEESAFQAKIPTEADLVNEQIISNQIEPSLFPTNQIMAIGCELLNLQYPSDIEITFESNLLLTFQEYIEQYDEIWIMRSVLPLKHKILFNNYAEKSEKFHLFDNASDLFSYKQDFVKSKKG